MEIEEHKTKDKILRELRRQAEYLTQRIHGQWQANRVKSWDEVQKMFGITVPEVFTKMTFGYPSLSLFYRHWIDTFHQRISAVDRSTGKLSLIPQEECSTFRKITLRPHQEPVYREAHRLFTQEKIRALLCDGKTGKGKTMVAGALIARLIKDNILMHPMIAWRSHPFMIFCPKAVGEKWRRDLEAMGLGAYVSTRHILVFESSILNTDMGKMYFKEYEDEIEETWKVKIDPVHAPYMAIIDECQEYINPTTFRTRCIEALGLSPCSHMFFMSATPGECVNDLEQFVRAIPFNYQGMIVNKNNFKIFAQAHDDMPSKPNVAAMKRLRATLSPYILSFPYTKPKHKAIRIVKIVEFEKPEDRIIYDTIIERYHEVCRKIGKDPSRAGRFQKAVALNKLNHGVEPLRAYYCAKKAYDNYASRRYSTLIGCGFKETIATITFRLIEQYKIPRDKISIIWGGRKDIKAGDVIPPEDLSKLLTSTSLEEFLANPDLAKKLRLTVAYREDQISHGETNAEQEYRHNLLREYGLAGNQSANARQTEVDRFLNGITEICLATVAVGGVGLDLDKKYPHVLPRNSLFTQVYSGRRFIQLLGRDVRENSIADSEQEILMMRDTAEEYHIAPILDAKLKSTASFTGSTFDIVDILDNMDVPEHIQRVRSMEEARKEAEDPNYIPPEIEETSTPDEDEDEEENNNE